jgi:uncharacterized protein YwgA
VVQESRFAIIRFIVDKLKDVGKIRVQKLVYFLQWIFDVPLGYDYKMHYYGPYSDELNDDLIAMQMSKNVEIGADPTGYGYHIIPGAEVVTTKDDVLSKYSEKISKCLREFGKFSPNELEILGTLHFVKYIAGVSNEAKIIEKTSMLKPVFLRSTIEETYKKLESIINSAS